MMKWTVAVSLVLMTSILCSAQDEAPRALTPGEARLEGLENAWAEHLENYWKKRQEAVAKAEASGESIPAISMRPPLGDFLEKFEKAALDFKGSDEAVPFLMWIVHNTMSDKKDLKHLEAAISTLLEKHLKSERLDQLPYYLPPLGRLLGEEKTALYLKTIATENPHGDVRAHCILARFAEQLADAPLESENYKRARKELLRAKALAQSKELQAAIQGKIDSREKLIDGQTAPEIEGIDLDGIAFKLSDYRGKIIMLDFWGDW